MTWISSFKARFFSWSSSQQGHNVKIPPPKCAHTLRRRFRHYSWQNSKFLEGSYKGSCWFFIIFKTITSNDTNFWPKTSRLTIWQKNLFFIIHCLVTTGFKIMIMHCNYRICFNIMRVFNFNFWCVFYYRKFAEKLTFWHGVQQCIEVD